MTMIPKTFSDQNQDVDSDESEALRQLQEPLLRREDTQITSVDSDDCDGDCENQEIRPIVSPISPTSSPSLPIVVVDAQGGDEGTRDWMCSKSYQGHFILVFVAFLFGTFNICFRTLYSLPEPPSPSALNTARGWMVVFLFIPLFCHNGCKKSRLDNRVGREEEEVHIEEEMSPRGHSKRSIWFVATEAALWNFASQAFFTVGLRSTQSARASFLSQTTVIMVPFISSFAGDKIKPAVWMGCLSSVVGLLILASTHDEESNSHGEDSTAASAHDNHSSFQFMDLQLGSGDLMILCGVFFWSFYVFRLSSIGNLYDTVHFQGIKNIMAALLYSIWCFVDYYTNTDDTPLWGGWDNPKALGILAFSAFGPGLVADLLQQKGQQTVDATASNLILSVEPVFTTLLGRLILGEQTCWLEKMGGGCLILGALISAR